MRLCIIWKSRDSNKGGYFLKINTLEKKHTILYLLIFILVFFLLLSCLYEPVLSRILTIRVDKTMINEKLAYPPFSPLEVKPFGTDILGFTILAKLIQGFKYTFFIGLLLSVSQIIISLILSSLAIYKLGIKLLVPIFSYLDKVFVLIPKPFLLLLLLGPYYQIFLFSTNEIQPIADTNFMVIQLFVLFLVGLPNLVKIYQGELAHLFKQDFAMASQSLGSSKFRTVRYSFKLQLTELTLNLVFKVLTQNVSLFIYLAYFQLYLGGSLVMQLDASTKYTVTLSNEWSGLIGQNIIRLSSTPWTVLIPLAFYGCLILLLNRIKRVLVGGMQNR